MEEQNEVKSENEGGNVYHEYDNSVHYATNLWPLAFIGAWAAIVILAITFLPDAKHQAERVPSGKAFSAIGQIVDCQPVSAFGNGPYRSFVRTPSDEFFSVYWRRDFQPPVFGAAIGNLKYHQCGTQDGVSVHCFDAFAVTAERVKLLDLGPAMPAALKK